MSDEKIVRKILLENTSGKSNKFYEIAIKETGNAFGFDEGKHWVVTRWGTRTKNWMEYGGQIKVIAQYVPSSGDSHRRVKNILQSKLDKGYTEVIIPEEVIIKKQLTQAQKDLEEDPTLERFSMI